MSENPEILVFHSSVAGLYTCVSNFCMMIFSFLLYLPCSSLLESQLEFLGLVCDGCFITIVADTLFVGVVTSPMGDNLLQKLFKNLSE